MKGLAHPPTQQAGTPGRLLSDVSASSPSGHAYFLNKPRSQPCLLSRSRWGLPGFPLPRPAECLASSWCGKFSGTDGGSSPFYVRVSLLSSTPKTPSVLFWGASCPPHTPALFLSCSWRQFYSEPRPNPNWFHSVWFSSQPCPLTCLLPPASSFPVSAPSLVPDGLLRPGLIDILPTAALVAC